MKFHCPNCSQKIAVGDDYAGKRGKCPKCGEILRIPTPQEQTDQTHSRIIKFRCPHCNQKIGVAEDYAGKRVRCAKCRQPLRIPGPKAKPPETPAEKPPTPEQTPAEQTVDEMMLDDDALTAAASAEAAAPGIQDITGSDRLGHAAPSAPPGPPPPPDDALRVVPPTPSPQTGAEINCPACGAPNNAGAEVCAACSRPLSAPTETAAPSRKFGLPVAIGASMGFTLAGIIVWVFSAYLIGWSRVQILAVGVAALAGLGLRLFTDKRNAAIGVLAIFIALFGIIGGKLAIAQWVILPQLEDPFAQAEVQDVNLPEEEVERRAKDPHQLFRAACFELVEEGEFDEEFAWKVIATKYGGRAPLDEAEEIKAAIKKVDERVSSWSPSEKRDAIRKQHVRDMEAFKGFGKAMVGALSEALEEDANVPSALRESAREANDIVSGEKKVRETMIGRGIAFGGSCCVGILWIPVALVAAYVIPTRRS